MYCSIDVRQAGRSQSRLMAAQEGARRRAGTEANPGASHLGSHGVDPAPINLINARILAAQINAATGFFWLFGHLAGMIILAVAQGRAKVVKRWVSIALIDSQPVHFIAAVVVPGRLLDVALGWGLTTVCMPMAGAAVLRMSDDEWDLAPLARRAL